MPRSPEVVDKDGKAWIHVEVTPELKADVLKAMIDERMTLRDFVVSALVEKVEQVRRKGGSHDADVSSPRGPARRPRRRP